MFLKIFMIEKSFWQLIQRFKKQESQLAFNHKYINAILNHFKIIEEKPKHASKISSVLPPWVIGLKVIFLYFSFLYLLNCHEDFIDAGEAPSRYLLPPIHPSQLLGIPCTENTQKEKKVREQNFWKCLNFYTEKKKKKYCEWESCVWDHRRVQGSNAHRKCCKNQAEASCWHYKKSAKQNLNEILFAHQISKD